MNYSKYVRRPVINLSSRDWPTKQIEKAPIWCSVDLRDGNQALIEPMVVDEKLEFFKLLIEMGFKQIEVGFPSASTIEYDFVRRIIECGLIPDDVTIQVVVPCRDHLILRTFEAVAGAKNVIFHIYNPTSTLQRDVVFNMTKDEIKKIATDAAKLVLEGRDRFEGNMTLEYSPESFTDTEPEFALEVCNAVLDIWKPTKEKKCIIDFPATMETNTPNVFADSIEWLNKNLNYRDSIILSIHPHNDRGTGVAISELALLAGAERIEGTLFGNGERTGNVDLLTIALNMFSQGVDPGLNIDNILHIREVYERLIKLPVPERHPYAGDFVFTAFSGGHQDAINKGIAAMKARGTKTWQVPYLPIDPCDIGRVYESIVRINSQSGKGGVAFVMESYHGFKLPKGMAKEFAVLIQTISEEKQGEVDPDQIMWEFKKHYIDAKEPYHFRKIRTEDIPTYESEYDYHTCAEVTYTDHGETKTFSARGNGPIDATKAGVEEAVRRKLKILDYSEHALGAGSNAQAAAYIHLLDVASGYETYGVGVSSSTTRAAVRAIFSAVNRITLHEEGQD